MPSIFVSYRRTDAAGHAGRLYDRLLERFGADNVFRDLDTLEPGADFAEVIRDTVARSDALLAVMGSGWLSAAAEDGTRRLDDRDDWVRTEIRTAFELGVRVVPVPVQDAKLPTAEELPDDMRPLARRHALVMVETVWRQQVDQLLENLERAVRRRSGPPEAARGVEWAPAPGHGDRPAEAWAPAHRLAVRASPDRYAAWSSASARSGIAGRCGYA